MMNSVERVKQLCKERHIPISKLEKELKFANGYISQLRKGMFPADRLKEIARYLSVSEEFLLNGTENETAPTPGLKAKDERDIAKKLQSTLDDLENGADGLMFDGEPLDDETRALLRDSLQNQLQMTKLLAKQKFTPKKYRR